MKKIINVFGLIFVGFMFMACQNPNMNNGSDDYIPINDTQNTNESGENVNGNGGNTNPSVNPNNGDNNGSNSVSVMKFWKDGGDNIRCNFTVKYDGITFSYSNFSYYGLNEPPFMSIALNYEGVNDGIIYINVYNKLNNEELAKTFMLCYTKNGTKMSLLVEGNYEGSSYVINKLTHYYKIIGEWENEEVTNFTSNFSNGVLTISAN